MRRPYAINRTDMTETTTYTLIDGRKVSNDIKNEIAQKVTVRKQQGKKIPHLAIIVVGDDGASQTYVDNKVKACKAVGFHYTMMRFADTISEQKLMKHIDHVDNDDDVDTAWAAEVERRSQEIKQGIVRPIPWAAVKAQARKRVRARR